jgi:hypothetical protein
MVNNRNNTGNRQNVNSTTGSYIEENGNVYHHGYRLLHPSEISNIARMENVEGEGEEGSLNQPHGEVGGRKRTLRKRIARKRTVRKRSGRKSRTIRKRRI